MKFTKILKLQMSSCVSARRTTYMSCDKFSLLLSNTAAQKLYRSGVERVELMRSELIRRVDTTRLTSSSHKTRDPTQHNASTVCALFC